MDTETRSGQGVTTMHDEEEKSAMNNSFSQTAQATPEAAALFVGDFNVGKSSVLNALMRRNLLFTSREESRTPPVFLTRSGEETIAYSAYNPEEKTFTEQSHTQFLSTRRHGRTKCPFSALSVLVPQFPFTRLTLIDTPGTSTEVAEDTLLPAGKAADKSLIVLVTTVEYWPARHTLALITDYAERFSGRFLVVANMADQLNHGDILRIRDKAAQRIESHSHVKAPPFYIVSAKLEFARRNQDDEYRHRVKREVRDICDAGFDALRVALYEFEAKCQTPEGTCPLDRIVHPLVTALISNNQQEQEA